MTFDPKTLPQWRRLRSWPWPPSAAEITLGLPRSTGTILEGLLGRGVGVEISANGRSVRIPVPCGEVHPCHGNAGVWGAIVLDGTWADRLRHVLGADGLNTGALIRLGDAPSTSTIFNFPAGRLEEVLATLLPHFVAPSANLAHPTTGEVV